MKFITFLIITVSSCALFAAVNVTSSRLKNPMSDEAVMGKKVWQANNCISCHTIFGNGGYAGDDLTHVVAKRNSEELIQFLASPPVMRPNRKKLHPGVSNEEAAALVSYFEYLQTIPTLGWPPQAYELRGGL